MTVETEVQPFLIWLVTQLPIFLFCLMALGVLATFGGFLTAVFRHGPGEAFYLTARVIFTGVAELAQISPRRALAIARLTFQESIRRRVLVAFGIFVAVLLLAGWFLDPTSEKPARLYISFVLTSTTYLVLVMALFLSTFSLPADIKNRTIFTVVTKPVRAWEIVLGRILGFCAIGTLLLVIMGALSYVFVLRGLGHAHRLDHEHLTEVYDESGQQLIHRQGESTANSRHRHEVEVNLEGEGRTDVKMGHWHPVTPTEDSEKRYVVGRPQGWLQARVPHYGKVRFLDRTGRPGPPISVGYEWTYRDYFEGGTLAAAVWIFEGVTRETFSQGLPLEMTIRVFRTYKGNIEQGIQGSLRLRNPQDHSTESVTTNFSVQEFNLGQVNPDRKFFPVKIDLADGRKGVDLFEQLVDDNGRIEVILQCNEPAQYFGVARADVYLRAGDNSFAWNFFKAYLSIWSQMVLVTSFGVMFSTFLSAAVGMLTTLGTVVLGFFADTIVDLALSVFQGEGPIEGGGPIEAMIRLFTQMNVTLPLDIGLATWPVQAVDKVIMFFMWAVAHLLPNYKRFDNVIYVAEGFNVPASLWSQQCVTMVVYVLVVTCLGYFLLKTREIAA